MGARFSLSTFPFFPPSNRTGKGRDFCVSLVAMNRSEPKYGIAIFKDVMVSMRDGVRLATNIYRPTLDGALVTRGVSHHFGTHIIR